MRQNERERISRITTERKKETPRDERQSSKRKVDCAVKRKNRKKGTGCYKIGTVVYTMYCSMYKERRKTERAVKGRKKDGRKTWW